MIVLGIDPGTANTGYGVVMRRSGRLAALDGGVIATRAELAPERRLELIHRRVLDIAAEHEVDAFALEDVYFGQNAHSAFAVGQARGVVMLAAALRGVPCALLHAPAGQGRRLRPGPRAEGSGGAHGAGAARAAASCRRPTTPPTRSPWPSATPTRRRCRAPSQHAGGAPVIALLRGEVAVRRPDHVVVLTAPGSATAWRCPARRCATCRPPARRSSLHAHLVVRDDALTLYGFASEQERDLFLMLLSVQAVGPKVALAVLSVGAAARADRRDRRRRRAPLPGGPGVGKRTAERIIVELREKVGATSTCPRARRASAPGRRPAPLAREGLLELGYTPGEVEELLDGAAGGERRGAHRRRAAHRAGG